MTDNEIIKALECCAYSDGCEACPISRQCDGAEHLTNALDLINRQKAEIERLQKAIRVQDVMIEQQEYKFKTAKFEAIKEFAERLKEAKANSTMDSRICTTEMIDNLVKEMTEEKK